MYVITTVKFLTIESHILFNVGLENLWHIKTISIVDFHSHFLSAWLCLMTAGNKNYMQKINGPHYREGN